MWHRLPTHTPSLALALGGMLIAAAGNAHAQDNGQDQRPLPVADLEEDARLHFELGRRAFQRAEFEEATREFDSALQLSQRDELHYDLYLCYRELGDSARAIEHLRAYLPTVTDEARHASLQARLERLERSLAAGGASNTEADEDAVPPRQRSLEPTPWVIAGAGGALIVVGAILGGVALDHNATLDRLCTPAGCPESARDTASSGRAFAIASDALWITGAVAAVAGLVWGIFDLTASTASPTVTAGCDMHGCSVQMAGSL